MDNVKLVYHHIHGWAFALLSYCCSLTLSGRVVGAVSGDSCSHKDGGPSNVNVELITPSGDVVSSVSTSSTGSYSFNNIIPGLITTIFLLCTLACKLSRIKDELSRTWPAYMVSQLIPFHELKYVEPFPVLSCFFLKHFLSFTMQCTFPFLLNF